MNTPEQTPVDILVDVAKDHNEVLKGMTKIIKVLDKRIAALEESLDIAVAENPS